MDGRQPGTRHPPRLAGGAGASHGVCPRTPAVASGMTTFTPATSADVLSAVQWAAAEGAPLEILGHGTKRGIGRPLQTGRTRSTCRSSRA